MQPEKRKMMAEHEKVINFRANTTGALHSNTLFSLLDLARYGIWFTYVDRHFVPIAFDYTAWFLLSPGYGRDTYD